MEGKIIGLGEILWDMLPTGKQLGGAPANFAYHVCRLGGNGWAVSAISDDELGREIKSTLSAKKLNTILEEVNEPTGTVQVTLNAAGVPTYDITEGVAWDHIPFTERIGDLAKETSAVCFGTLAQRSPESRATIHEFIENMPAGSLKVYDINLRQNYYDEKIISDSLRLADILKINDEELDIVSKMLSLSGTQEERCRAISRAFNLKFVILTKGGDGSEVVLEDKVHISRPGKIDIVDTVGAGDSFTAAFILAYLRGESLEKAHTLATEVSSYVCTKAGAMPE
uniref:carbohydrate kinase family protein n=1 Tax=Candidatus Cryptobacteroides bacterium TaxID=3085639 RepID=UPI004028F378